VIAGMEGVTIIHGCSCEGREVYLLPAGKSGVGDRVVHPTTVARELAPAGLRSAPKTCQSCFN
jgi:hypothetical protein